MNEEENLLLNIIEENSANNYNFLVLTTFEFSLTFFEDYLMKSLPKDTFLLIDARKYNRVLSETQPSKKFLTFFQNKIIPINFQKGVFHPKLILFCGDNKFCSYVSSANLTKSGYTRNIELVSKFQNEILAFEIIEYIKKILENCKGSAKKLLEDKISPLRLGTGKNSFTDFKILGNNDEPIMEQFLSYIIDKKFIDLYICSPYLDINPDEIIECLEKIKVENRNFILQTINAFKIDTVEFLLKSNYKLFLFNKNRLLHAKFIYLHNKEEDYLLLGSANFTKQAMLRDYKKGNCELNVLVKINTGIFKDKYLKHLELTECEDITNLKFEPQQSEVSQIKDIPMIIESYIKSNRLNIEVSGNYLDYSIYVFNSENELVKIFKLEDCIIKELTDYFKLVINYPFKKDIYKIIFKKGYLESNISYFTTDVREYTREDYTKEIFGEDFNIPLLYKVAERIYFKIIGKSVNFAPINLKKLLPNWKAEVTKTLSSFHKLLKRGLKKIKEYITKINIGTLTSSQYSLKIEDLINWELENILSIPLNDELIKINLDLLRELVKTIAELNKIEDSFEKTNLEFWKLISLLIYTKNKKINVIDLLDLLRKLSINMEDDPENLKTKIVKKLENDFNSFLVNKIENENYIDKKQIEILKIIIELDSTLSS